MKFDKLIEYKGEQHKLEDVLFMVIYSWHTTTFTEDIEAGHRVIDEIMKHTPLTEEECVDWVIEFRQSDFEDWSKTPVGKKFTSKS